MADSTVLFVWFLGAFLVSVGVSYALVRGLEVRKRPSIPEGTVLRIRGATGVHRSRLLGKSGNEWRISAPLMRDSYVPYRSGESLLIEAAGPRGAALFRTQVLGRDDATHEIVLAAPRTVHQVERRSEPRLTSVQNLPVRVDGNPSQVLDLSSLGAKLLSSSRCLRGDRIRLDLAPYPSAIFGYVLEALPEEGKTVVRVRFEEAIDLGLASSKA
ncbi:MAG TPA: hypothetical protein VEX38_02330 [Fimbriimonadaceae bacterium]|nr:hypothetical protein [Fimbriimonadaceae bacterium]